MERIAVFAFVHLVVTSCERHSGYMKEDEETTEIAEIIIEVGKGICPCPSKDWMV